MIGEITKMDKIFKALSDPTRRRILQLLREHDMTAGELADRFTLGKSTLSAHFQVLRDAELVTSTKSGTSITYRLNLSALEEALRAFAAEFGLSLQGEPGRASGADRDV